MRARLLLPLLFLPIAGLGVAAAASPPGVTVKAARHKSVGTIIVTARGRTLYHMSTETKKGQVKCVGACAKIWVPLTVTGGAKPVAGPGIAASKLGTVRRPDGLVQVTYNGFGLYRYVFDKKPGAVTSQGLGGIWYAITPAGTLTKTGGTGGQDCPAGQSIPPDANDGYDADDSGGPTDADGCV